MGLFSRKKPTPPPAPMSVDKTVPGPSGELPSPPHSPIDAHGRNSQPPPAPSLGQPSRDQQGPPDGNAFSNSPRRLPDQHDPPRPQQVLSAPRNPNHSVDGRDFSRATPSSFSSDASNVSNVLYNDEAAVRSSAGTAVSDRERYMEGKLGGLGLERRKSNESIEMHDGTTKHQPPPPPQHDVRHSQEPVARAKPQQEAQDTRRHIEIPVHSVETLSPTPSQASAARKTSSRYNLADFAFIRTLGTGSFGRVHLVRSKHNSRSYAVKVLSKDRVVKMKQVEHTNSEREMLERVRHPFLVNLWGTFKCSKNLYMVMDFVAGGELFSLLRKSQRFPDPVAKFFAAEVALGLDYLHSLDIIYRDLKPENILLGADGHVKITDFGFAKHVPDITWTLCGTPDYLAPEIVQSRGYNKSVDWYALGVLMFEMLAGYPPFFTEDANPMRLYEKIIAGKVRYPSYFAPDAKDLLKSLLTSDITKRFGNLANGSRDIFGHSWFQEVDWERLYRKEIPAPYVPKVEGDADASNFDSYPEVDTAEYGAVGPDPHANLFLLF